MPLFSDMVLVESTNRKHTKGGERTLYSDVDDKYFEHSPREDVNAGTRAATKHNAERYAGSYAAEVLITARGNLLRTRGP